MRTNRPILQAPWRTQRQKIGALLLAIVGGTMIAALYLSVASRATLVGREIQTLEREISMNKEKNANLKTELARLLSLYATETRSEALGFRPAAAEETHYLPVPGYPEEKIIALAKEEEQITNHAQLPAAYSMSLFDWFSSNMQKGNTR